MTLAATRHLGLVLPLALWISGCAPASQTSNRLTDVARVLRAADGPSTLDANTTYLTTQIGGRMSGSPNMRKAVAWAVDAFRRAGVDEVHVERFQMPATWSPGEPTLTLLGNEAFPVRVVSIAWAPAVTLEARIVDVAKGSDADFARAGAAARGAMVLVHTDVLQAALDEYVGRAPVLAAAANVGVGAILWMSTREGSTLYRRQELLTGNIDPLPAAIVARDDGLRMSALLAKGQPLRAKLSMPNQSGGPMEEENVVAEIRGREKPDEFVVLGAHLDSWELGTGALDDGCNAALVIEVARILHESGARPRRTIRLVLFSGEEQGMHGSRAYVRAHADELDRTSAAVIFDRFNGRTRGFVLAGRPELIAPMNEILVPLVSWDVGHHSTVAPLETDNLDFLLEGVPTVVADQDQTAGVAHYHASTDTLDKIDFGDLRRNTTIAAVTVAGIAERPDLLARRQSRSEIEALMRANPSLERDMRDAAIWSQWESGARGRR